MYLLGRLYFQVKSTQVREKESYVPHKKRPMKVSKETY